MKNFLFKVLTKAYYQQNTGFFLVLVIGAFGLLRGDDHKALADLGMNSLPFLAMFFMSFWVLYTLKAIQFVLKSFTDPRQEFLYLLRLLPWSKQVSQLVVIQYSLLQPIIAYGLFVAYRGYLLEKWTLILVEFVFFLVLIVAPVFWYMSALKKPNQSQNRRTLASYFNLRFTKPYPLFFVQYLLEDQKMVLFLSKILSCFFVVGVCILFHTDQYDHRLISIGILLAGLSHSSIAPLYHSFEHEFLLFGRNLPIPKLHRFAKMLITYFLLLLPEFILLIRHLPHEVSWVYFPGAVVFLLGIVLGMHHYRYYNPDDPDSLSKVLATGFFLSLLMIMYHIPVVVPGLCMIGVSGFLFFRYYTGVEYRVGEE